MIREMGPLLGKVNYIGRCMVKRIALMLRKHAIIGDRVAIPVGCGWLWLHQSYIPAAINKCVQQEGVEAELGTGGFGIVAVVGGPGQQRGICVCSE